MPTELDSGVAERIVSSAIACLRFSHGEKIVCTKSALKDAILEAVLEAYEIGYLTGQKEEFSEAAEPGSPNRPPWMDIRLDNPEALGNHGIRLRPVVLKSLHAAGYHCLGDLRWVSRQQLTALYYVGRKTARQIRAAVERLEQDR